MDLRTVIVPVSNIWSNPDLLREGDGLMTAAHPDAPAWLAAMDAAATEADGRLGLDPALDTQVVEGEPVQVLEDRGDGWLRVALPWQPHEDGPYTGWLRAEHVQEGGSLREPEAHGQATPETLLAQARTHLGLPYLWGGTSPLGLDCSGLIHHTFRHFGLVVPRDAHVQQEVARPIPPGEERAGDLYFFAREGRGAHHVGFVVRPGVLLHAPQTGEGITEEQMPPARLETLVGAGRLLG